jgi:hypothetical protein
MNLNFSSFSLVLARCTRRMTGGVDVRVATSASRCFLRREVSDGAEPKPGRRVMLS